MLQSLEGIVEFLHVETGRMPLNIINDINTYIMKHQQEHPGRNELGLARQYLIDQVQKMNYQRELEERVLPGIPAKNEEVEVPGMQLAY